MKTIATRSKWRAICVICLFIIITIYTLYNIHTVYSIQTAITDRDDLHDDGFYSYVLNKGISIQNLSAGVYRISHLKWNCIINTSVAKNFRKRNISWKDLFETRIEVLRKRTIFTPEQLRKKMGVLPKDGTPITLIAHQGNVSVPKENVIIRANRHGPLDARTTMIVAFANPVETLTRSARNQSNDEIIHWNHYYHTPEPVYIGLVNTSHPMVVPEKVWNIENLKYYRGPLFFLKGEYFIGNFAKTRFYDFIGMMALYKIAHLKGTITTVGFSTVLDSYNLVSRQSFECLAHKLAWAYYVVEELTDNRNVSQEFGKMTFTRKADAFSSVFLNLGNVFIYLIVIVIICVLIFN